MVRRLNRWAWGGVGMGSKRLGWNRRECIKPDEIELGRDRRKGMTLNRNRSPAGFLSKCKIRKGIGGY